MEHILNLLSLPTIFALPWGVKGPGLFLIALFLLRALRSLFSLRLITVFTSLIYVVIIAIILSQAGNLIAQMIGLEPAKQALIIPASPLDFRYNA